MSASKWKGHTLTKSAAAFRKFTQNSRVSVDAQGSNRKWASTSTQVWIQFRHFTEVYIHSLYSCLLFRLLVPSVWSQQTCRIPYEWVRTCWSSHSAGVGTRVYLRYICRFQGEKASQPDREVTGLVDRIIPPSGRYGIFRGEMRNVENYGGDFISREAHTVLYLQVAA